MGEDGETEEWLSAADAVRSCRALFVEEEWQSRGRLIQLAADEFVRTRCVRWIQRDGATGRSTLDDCELDAGFWENFRSSPKQEEWDTGLFGTQSPYDPFQGVVTTTVHGAQFCVTDLFAYANSLRSGTKRPAGRVAPPSRNEVGQISAEDAAHARAKWAEWNRKRLARGQPRTARVPPPYQAKPAVAEPRPKKVTKDELRQWFPTYEAQSNDFRADSVLEAASGYFAPRSVSRQPVRDIIGEFERTRTRGKPTAS